MNTLEDLKGSPDLIDNLKIGQGQHRLIIETYFALPFSFGIITYVL